MFSSGSPTLADIGVSGMVSIVVWIPDNTGDFDGLSCGTGIVDLLEGATRCSGSKRGGIESNRN